jgi:sterol desaturase/sphingolipid hydroxylase (fatty acid hydroxylase superfamily)
MTILNFLQSLLNEATSFLGINSWINMIRWNNFSELRTWDGFTRAVAPILPFLLVFEILRALWTRTFEAAQYRAMFLALVFNRVISIWLTIGATAFAIGLFAPLAPLTIEFSWYGVVYAYLVWELSHFVFHYLSHKVRLFWCIHSPHHAPETMNLLVNQTHFFLEYPLANFIRTSICMLLGLSLPLLLFVAAIDAFWGGFIHVGEHIFKNARFGPLERWILTPSHHRVHHSRNPIYLDTNYCNLLNVWDRLFGTFQPELERVPPEYGVTRKPNSASFVDIYFGEWLALVRDVWAAPGLLNKLCYIVMPPGWSHTGEHKTAAILRANYLLSVPVPTIYTAALAAGEARSQSG